MADIRANNLLTACSFGARRRTSAAPHHAADRCRRAKLPASAAVADRLGDERPCKFYLYGDGERSVLGI
jgi:hypothetical protein